MVPRTTAYLHLVGVGLSVCSVVVGGISHDTGVAIAIGTVSLLGAQPLPETAQPERVQIHIGAITQGGMRQGQFIKLLFATALVSSGTIQQVVNDGSGISSVLLGSALALSRLANEFEIRTLQHRLSDEDTRNPSGYGADNWDGDQAHR